MPVGSLPLSICPYFLFLFWEQHIVKRVLWHHIPSHSLAERTVHHLADFLNRTWRQGFCPSFPIRSTDRRGFLEFGNKSIDNATADILNIILSENRIDVVLNQANIFPGPLPALSFRPRIFRPRCAPVMRWARMMHTVRRSCMTAYSDSVLTDTEYCGIITALLFLCAFPF